MPRTVEGRVAYADLLRVLATIAAVILFVSTRWMDDVGAGSSAFTVLSTYSGLTRWCVPMFVMLSGAFLLDPKKSLRGRDLFLKYILRVIILLLVWGTLYALIDYSRTGGRVTWAGVKEALHHVLWADTHHHLWFLYLMLGLYLVTPILRAFVRGASRATFHWFFVLVVVFYSLIPTLRVLFPAYAALPAVWSDQLGIRLVLGYVGYYVAGYYLKHFTLNRLAEFAIYILGVLGAAAVLWETLTPGKGLLYAVLSEYHAPHVAALAVAVFVLFRYVLGVSEERSRRQRLIGMARITFGIYVLHDLFLMLLDYLDISTLSFNPVVAVPVLSAAVFLCSFAVAWLLSKIPLIGRYLT